MTAKERAVVKNHTKGNDMGIYSCNVILTGSRVNHFIFDSVEPYLNLEFSNGFRHFLIVTQPLTFRADWCPILNTEIVVFVKVKPLIPFWRIFLQRQTNEFSETKKTL